MSPAPGDPGEAIERLRLAVARSPDDAALHEELGIALLAANRVDAAAEAFLEALRRDRARVRAHFGLARIFDSRGDAAVAEGGYRQVLRLDPDHAAARSRLGQLLAMSHVEEAEAHLRRALALDPGDIVAARLLAYALRRLNRVAEARDVARSILERHPDDLSASLVVELSIPPVPASSEDAAEARQRFARGVAALEARTESFARDPAQVLGLQWENFTLAYLGGDVRPLQEAYGRFVSALLSRAAPALMAPRPRRRIAPGERPRVGFLSSFLYDCTVGKYFRSWIAGLDRNRFEVFAYHTGHAKDSLTAAIAQSAGHFRHAFEPAPAIARRVLADRLDVLVFPDVGMETTASLVAAMHLAPVQCAGWGHPVTTGLPSMDWFLSCGEMEPEGAQAHYTERLLRLPGIGVSYARPVLTDGGSRAQFGLPVSGRLYLCPQSAFKIHPDNDALFAEVIAADPEGRLVFFHDFDRPLTAFLRDRVEKALAGRGLDPSRALFLERTNHADYLKVNALCDAFLDTRHWSGGNTTLDAIAAGLPPVTLPGDCMRGRQSAAMLRQIDLGDLVASDEADYVRIATRLARDRAWRDDVTGRMQEASARLFDQAAPLATLQDFLDEVARGTRA